MRHFQEANFLVPVRPLDGPGVPAGWLMQVRSRRPGWWPKQTT